MELLGEVVLKPTFPADEFEKLRRQVLTGLEVESASPEYQAEKQFRLQLYGNHPYSQTATGEIEDVNALEAERLRQWWVENFRPDEAILIFSGDIGSARAFELAKKTLGNWRKPDTRFGKRLAKIEPVQQTHIYLVDRPGSIQSQIRMGHLGITRHDDGYFVSRVVSNYFGWAYNSRLNETVRVKKGLTYGAWGGYEANRFAGSFKLGTFTKTESTADAVRAVIEEIERLKSEPPSEEELEESRSYILGSFVRNRETPQQVASDLWLIESQQLGDDYLARLLDGIAEAQSEDCGKLVERTVNEDDLVIVVVGEAQKLKADLEQIAPVTVIEAN
jgi:zinc protease